MSAADKSAAHLIVGGGLAGSMVGLRLAAAGREVVLLERERGPHHKVCGEFLSPEAQQYLKQAGIDPLALGAQAIRGVRLTSQRRVIETSLPFTALSLSRYALDEALLNRAAQLGCIVERGTFVETLTKPDNHWQAQLRGGKSCSAPTVFLANGKHDLHDFERKPAPQTDLIGFKLHWRLAPVQTEALRGFMDLYLFRDGYGGLSLVEGDAANLCFVVRRSTLRSKGGWDELLTSIQSENPHVAQRLSCASPLWERPLAVSPIPYGYLTGRPHGLWCVGDQAAVIPSFTGDGMSIALHSATLAAQMYLAGESADRYHQQLRAQLKPAMCLATALSRTMVTGFGRALAPIALSALPSSMRWIANSTRIPQKALCHTSVE